MAPRVVLVTGANSGIGLSIAKVLVQASEDFHVIMTGRSLEKVNAAKVEIEALGIKGSLSAVQMDVTSEETVDAAAKHVREEHGGRLDVLINNAGVGSGQDNNIRARFLRCMDTNVVGPATVAEAFRPMLLGSPNAYSLYIGSGPHTLVRNALEQLSDSRRLGHTDAYQVSKAAMNMLAVTEMRDYGPQGLKVFVVRPGFVRSNLRGTSEEQISGWGKAGDPDTAGELVLDILSGNRDADVGGFVEKGGRIPW